MHQPASELVNEDDPTPLQDVVPLSPIQRLGIEGLLHEVHLAEVRLVVDVQYAGFALQVIDTLLSQLDGALLLAHAAVTFAEHAEIQNVAATQIAALQTDVDTLYAWRLLWFPEATPGDLD